MALLDTSMRISRACLRISTPVLNERDDMVVLDLEAHDLLKNGISSTASDHLVYESLHVLLDHDCVRHQTRSHKLDLAPAAKGLSNSVTRSNG